MEYLQYTEIKIELDYLMKLIELDNASKYTIQNSFNHLSCSSVATVIPVSLLDNEEIKIIKKKIFKLLELNAIS